MQAAIAADVAVEIDRLALSVHRPTGRRPELMAALVNLRLPPQSFVVVGARFLAAGRLTIDDLMSMSRYTAEHLIRAGLESHVRSGVLVAVDDESFVPSAEFQAGARVVLDLQAEEAERLWESAQDLAALAAVARAHVDCALDSALPLDAFRRQVGVHPAAPAAASELLGYITELRYLRSDVHAQCLAHEALSGPRARVLHRLWRGFDTGGPVDALVLAGLVEQRHEESRLTARGLEACARVENATNDLFAELFSPLDHEVSSALLAAMRLLPGKDPRPVEDR